MRYPQTQICRENSNQFTFDRVITQPDKGNKTVEIKSLVSKKYLPDLILISEIYIGSLKN